MKLPNPALDVEEQLREFDFWVTPATHEIQDTERYAEEIESIQFILNALGPATNEFEDPEHCSPEHVAARIVDLIEHEVATCANFDEKFSTASRLVESFSSLMFLVTGKADNALKCRFPVFLANVVGRTKFPHVAIRGGRINVAERELPRVMKQDMVAKLIGGCLVAATSDEGLFDLHHEAVWLLKTYISVILADEKSADQFWMLGRNYFSVKHQHPGKESALLAPLIVFKIKGSVSASGGHIPEDLMREHLIKWGLRPGIDFNTEDVVVTGLAADEQNTEAAKTRAYDFILPYATEGWDRRLFIQCQVYAGDSGSVSHKVVDQTTSSRQKTLQSYPEAMFIEYLDGAGYFSSLNGDLRHMLRMESTHSFFQIRSINVRLRREFQNIGFLTPLEVEIALITLVDKSEESLIANLEEEGYTRNEVWRVVSLMQNDGTLIRGAEELMLDPNRIDYARRILLIDVIALVGEQLEEGVGGCVLIPGYGRNFGTSMATLSARMTELAPGAPIDVPTFGTDITSLAEEGQIVLR